MGRQSPRGSPPSIHLLTPGVSERPAPAPRAEEWRCHAGAARVSDLSRSFGCIRYRVLRPPPSRATNPLSSRSARSECADELELFVTRAYMEDDSGPTSPMNISAVTCLSFRAPAVSRIKASRRLLNATTLSSKLAEAMIRSIGSAVRPGRGLCSYWYW